MTFLFGRGTPREKLAFIFRATKQHALNLGTFTPLYKLLTIAMRRLFEALGGKGRVPKWHSLVAGLIGGYVVFGERTPVNEQIVLYTSSRIMASFLPRAETRKDWPAGKPKPTDKSWFAAYATITWGVVMYLHQYRRETIQTGMVNSMDCKCRTSLGRGLESMFGQRGDANLSASLPCLRYSMHNHRSLPQRGEMGQVSLSHMQSFRH